MLNKTFIESVPAASIVAPESLTARELRIEATASLMHASRTVSLDLREHLIAKARVYRAAADSLEAARA
jgi:hypothetical protein